MGAIVGATLNDLIMGLHVGTTSGGSGSHETPGSAPMPEWAVLETPNKEVPVAEVEGGESQHLLASQEQYVKVVGVEGMVGEVAHSASPLAFAHRSSLSEVKPTRRQGMKRQTSLRAPPIH